MAYAKSLEIFMRQELSYNFDYTHKKDLIILNEQHSKTKILKCCLYENMTLEVLLS